MKHLKYIMLFCTLFSFNSRSQDFWQQTNGPYAPGLITAINAGLDGKIHVALAGVGLYVSTDGGETFSFLNRIVSQNIFISSIIVDHHGHIFIGDWSTGVYRSQNNGLTWENVLPKMFRTMTLNLNGYIFAGTNSDGIFGSSDDGNSWTQLNLDSTIKSVSSLASDPTGYLFASGWKSNWSEGTRTVRSSNNGTTWDSLNIPSNIYIKSFAFNQNGIIVASFHSTNPEDSSGFLISYDHGANWIFKNIVQSYYGTTTIIFDKPSNSFFAVMYEVTSSAYWKILRSTDNGLSWLNIASIKYKQPDSFCFTSNQIGSLFVGSIDGLSHSLNLGTSWFPINNGFFARYSNYLTLLPNCRIYTKTVNGVFRLNDNAVGWMHDSIPAGSFIISNNGNYFISDRYIYKSTNNGNSWTVIFYPPGGTFSATTEMTKLSNGYLLAGGTSYGGVHGTGSAVIWRSIDNGETWNAVYGHSPENWIYSIASSVNDLILAGGGEGIGIVKSTNLGLTWFPSINGLPSSTECRVIRVNKNGNIFLGTLAHGVFRSINDGLTWHEINNGLNSLDIRTIVFNSTGRIFIGTSSGVFSSTNNGDNWDHLNSGLIDFSVSALLCDSADYLYASTDATGIFRSISPTALLDESNVELLTYLQLNQNYPNPFNPNTKIGWQSPVGSHQTLKVFDVVGTEVATLVDEYKPAGSYEVEFEASSGIRNLASGIFFYQLKVGEFVETKKMLLLR